MKLRVIGQSIIPDGLQDKVASDSVEFVNVEFTFSEEWQGLSKFVQFTQHGKTYDIDMNGENIVEVPPEIKNGICEISVFGVNGAVRGTTIPYKVNVFKSGYVDNAEHLVEPTPTLFAQLIGRIEDIEQKAENGEFDGDGYIITPEDIEEIKQDMVPLIMEDVQPALDEVKEISERAENIARGKSESLVFDTVEEMTAWLTDINNLKTHNIGDNLYIKAIYTDETETVRQPDYWISDVYEEPDENGYCYEISRLGVEVPDLENCVTFADTATSSKTGVSKVNSKYGIGIDETETLFLQSANNTEIEAKSTGYKAITPKNLNYALQCVPTSETQFGTAKMWITTDENGEIGLNISTEV